MKIAAIGRGRRGRPADAAAQEAMLPLAFASAQEGGMPPFFHEFAPPAQF
jgi:hypothetical protein